MSAPCVSFCRGRPGLRQFHGKAVGSFDEGDRHRRNGARLDRYLVSPRFRRCDGGVGVRHGPTNVVKHVAPARSGLRVVFLEDQPHVAVLDSVDAAEEFVRRAAECVPHPFFQRGGIRRAEADQEKLLGRDSVGMKDFNLSSPGVLQERHTVDLPENFSPVCGDFGGLGVYVIHCKADAVEDAALVGLRVRALGKAEDGLVKEKQVRRIGAAVLRALASEVLHIPGQRLLRVGRVQMHVIGRRGRRQLLRAGTYRRHQENQN